MDVQRLRIRGRKIGCVHVHLLRVNKTRIIENRKFTEIISFSINFNNSNKKCKRRTFNAMSVSNPHVC